MRMLTGACLVLPCVFALAGPLTVCADQLTIGVHRNVAEGALFSAALPDGAIDGIVARCFRDGSPYLRTLDGSLGVQAPSREEIAELLVEYLKSRIAGLPASDCVEGKP